MYKLWCDRTEEKVRIAKQAGWKYLWQGRQIQCEHPAAAAKTQVTAVACQVAQKTVKCGD